MMEKEQIRNRLLRILDIAPTFKEIILSTDPIAKKRNKIKHFLADILQATFYDDLDIPPLEWILARDAFRAFRTNNKLR